MGEACQRLLAADPGDRLDVRQPFKRLVPVCLGDIFTAFVRAGQLRLPAGEAPVFTVASQEDYMREDAVLRTVADSLNRIRGTEHEYSIEELPPEDGTAFTYDLTRMNAHLVKAAEMTPFGEGVAKQLEWLMEREGGRPAKGAAVVVHLADVD